MLVTFSLNPIEVEVAEKISSMIRYSDRPEQVLLSRCAVKFTNNERRDVEKTLSFARSLKSENPDHPSMRAYISHPVRVASFVLQMQTQPSPETVQLALLHNVFEVSGLQEQQLSAAGYDERTARGIRILTIDRARQYDPDYLAIFYRTIEEFGEDLALVKCMDKLDNLLAFQLFERTEKINTYLELSDQFVTPMASRLNAELGKYFSDVIEYMRRLGCERRLKAQYDAFISEAG